MNYGASLSHRHLLSRGIDPKQAIKEFALLGQRISADFLRKEVALVRLLKR